MREATSTVSLSWAPRTCIARGETKRDGAVSFARESRGRFEPLGMYLVGQGVAGEVAGVHVDGQELPNVKDPIS